MHGIGGHGEGDILGEMVTSEGDAGARGDKAREAEGRRAMDAEGFLDGCVKARAERRTLVYLRTEGNREGTDALWQVFDHVIFRSLDACWEILV